MSGRDRIPSDSGYCPSLAELVDVPTTSAEKWINSGTATKATLSSLLKLAVQEIKKHTSLKQEISSLRLELQSGNFPPASATDVTAQLQDTIDNFRTTFRAEITDAIQKEVKNAIASQSQPIRTPELENKIDRLFESKLFMEQLHTNTDGIQSSTSEPLSARNDSHNYQVKIVGLAETEEKDPVKRSLADKTRVEETVKALKVEDTTLTDCYRQGHFNANKPRPLIARFSSIWDTRKILLAAHQQKFYTQSKILIIKDLSPREREQEKLLLKKRYDLVQQGVPKEKLKIRNLRLYKDNELIRLD